MKIFRKTRISAILEHKASKYILYAIGEIVLVIIGILIAVSINNANEKRKLQSELQSIYKTVANDLVRDTVNLAIIIEDNNLLDSLTRNYFSETRPKPDTINASNVEDCPECASLFSTYNDFTPSLGGYKSLINFESKSDIKRDSLTNKILNFYTNRTESIDDFIDKVSMLAVDNIRSLERFEWYTDLMRGEYSKDRVQYFLTSTEYKNKLLTFYLFNEGNLIKYLKEYKEGSVELIEQIEGRE